MTNLTEQLIKEKKELEKRNFDLHKLISEINEENKRLKHDVGNLGYKIKNQRKEIDNRLKEIEKLKELLKACIKNRNCWINLKIGTIEYFETTGGWQ